MQMISFISQKALYACVTCSVPNAPDFSPAGICLACSYACHNDHTLVELYTKRQFRCDCGNSKFPKSNRCRLRDDKDTINEKNEYNQNYRYILQFNLETFKSFHKIFWYTQIPITHCENLILCIMLGEFIVPATVRILMMKILFQMLWYR